MKNVYPIDFDLYIGSHYELINKPESNIALQGQIQEFWKGDIPPPPMRTTNARSLKRRAGLGPPPEKKENQSAK